MNRVFVLDTEKKPLMLTTPSRARRLLASGRAAVYRLDPFTIILKYTVDPTLQPIEFKVDPGSKTTGIALVGEFPKQGRVALFGANLNHRGDSIRKRLADRRAIRRGRRNRKTRYRPARFDHRARARGWLPPSLQSRVYNVISWLKKLLFRAPVSDCHIETVRFDTHKLQNPEISGVEYQQGTLFGYEVREYLLEKWGRTCAYCGKKNVPLEAEHIIPRGKGGSGRVSNLAIACRPCNQKKGNRTAAEFGYPLVQSKAKAPLKDAAAANATRYAIGNAIRAFGLPTSFWSSGRTKFNRTAQGYAKDHWIDAACGGETGQQVFIPAGLRPLQITATGRGTRQTGRTDAYGFPRNGAGRVKRVVGFQTGDLVRLIQPKGKYAGEHVGRLVGVRANGRLDIQAAAGKITANWRNFQLLQRGDGYAYAH
jgi:5-methylcytosine-specific restriction endonuclease McrA